ncbi:MAG: SUMF1/EgtB/PvdO family nonheme iron enzyme [Planctomycetes bacterium]|nr:SUMF1/EgtB/PvdO family nonheme iron enzyme [Planctomycetota bacterium]
MPEASEARASSPWPFVAISVLILLLAAFLYLRMSRKDRAPGPLDVRPVATTKDAEATADPRGSERAGLLEKARSSLDDGRIDDAASALAEARKIRPGDDIERIEGELVRLRAKAQEEEEQRRAALALGELKKNWEETWKPKYLWDQAAAAAGEFLKAHPKAANDPDFEALRREIERNRREHDEAYRMNLDAARKLHQEGRTAQALQKLLLAIQFYPERAGEIDALRAEWESSLLDKEMVRITDVEVWIGSDEVDDEKPKRRFRGKPYKIDRYEVTNEEYAAFLAANPNHPAPPYWKNRRYPPEAARFPVTCVRLGDAEAYARWARKRLPTEEEWEKAARFINGWRYPWGDDFPAPGSRDYPANSWEYWQNLADQGKLPGPVAVGTFPNGKSGFDVYDMAGNVWEWTSTRVPADVNGKKVEMGVLKGGSFMTTKEALRCSNRLLDEPDLGHPDYGFRCVKD